MRSCLTTTLGLVALFCGPCIPTHPVAQVHATVRWRGVTDASSTQVAFADCTGGLLQRGGEDIATRGACHGACTQLLGVSRTEQEYAAHSRCREDCVEQAKVSFRCSSGASRGCRGPAMH
jgi:hypothetical protein